MSDSEIQLIRHKDIDRAKWDSCVARSVVPLVYVRSVYLDIVSPDWDALVWGDYRYIMPLVIRHKLGISFLLQPIFAQQHGIFPEADGTIQTIFLAYIRDHFRYISIHLHAGHAESFPLEFEVEKRTNFILNLNPSYEELKTNYSKHARRLIRKAEENKVLVKRELETKAYIDLKNLVTGNKLSRASMQTLERLIETGTVNGNGKIYAAYTPEKTLCSAAYFYFDTKRVLYLNAASTDEGKANSSMYRIVDQFISDHAGSDLTLDFEGSSIPGIARFYAGFGAEAEYYYCLKLNRLPIPLRWFKK